MRRRDLIAAGTAAALAATASAAGASETPATAEGLALNIAGVGLPVIVGGRIRNYVFVTVKLYLGNGQTPEAMRARDPFFRDALVRTGHRAPFVLPGDWTRLNETAINAAIMPWRRSSPETARWSGPKWRCRRPVAAPACRTAESFQKHGCVASPHLARFRRNSRRTQLRVRSRTGGPEGGQRR